MSYKEATFQLEFSFYDVIFFIKSPCSVDQQLKNFKPNFLFEIYQKMIKKNCFIGKNFLYINKR